MVARELTIVGVNSVRHTFGRAAALLAAGTMPAARLHGPPLPLADTAAAIEAARRGPASRREFRWETREGRRLRRAGQWQLADLPDPEPGPGEVRIRVRATGVCGTDVHLHAGEFGHVYPLVPGHEIVGEVEWPGRAPVTAP